jgi:hypothetical protein
MANIEAVKRLPLQHPEIRPFLEECLQYLRPEIFKGLVTSRTIRSTRLTDDTVKKFVDEYGKATPLDIKEPLPPDVHAVNMWLTPEMKIRERIINEPFLNAAIGKHSLPRLLYPSRLLRRQLLQHCRYILQIDFDAYYNSIPLDPAARKCFVFKKGNRFYGLNTVPTGGRWSVAVGQALTWTIVDIQSICTVLTMIDNIAVGAKIGQEREFIATIRELVERIKRANLITTPSTADLERMSDKEILAMATEDQQFLGEVYTWNGEERLVQNSTKTLAKLSLSLAKTRHTFRTFAAMCSLIMYALHTINANPAGTFSLMQAYRAVGRTVSEGDWDAEMPFISSSVRAALHTHGGAILANAPAYISKPRKVSYNDEDYDMVAFIDACASGWGAFVRMKDTTIQIQQRWINTLGPQRSNTANPPQEAEPDIPGGRFTARYSAHTEPEAVYRLLEYLETRHGVTSETKIAVASDHFAITHAQRKLNGFGGIGRGASLNHMFERSNRLNVAFFYVAGVDNPADPISRNFGAGEDGNIVEGPACDITLPALRTTFCPLAEGEHRPTWMR